MSGKECFMDRTDKNTQNGFFNSENFNTGFNKQKVNSIPVLSKIVVYMTVVIFSAYIPVLMFYEMTANVMAILITVVCAVFLFLTVRRIDVLLPALLVSLLLVSVTGSITVTALFLGFLVAVGAASFVFSADTGKNLFFTIIMPVMSYFLSFAMTRDFGLSAISLTVYPVILVQGFMLRRRKDKLATIYSALAASVATLALALAVYMIGTNSGISFITGFIAQIRQQAANALAEYHVTDMFGESVYLFDSLTNAQAYVDSLFNILPALIFIAMFLIILLTYNYSVALTQSMGYAQRLRSNMLIIKPGVSAAAVFFAAFAISLTTDSTGNVLYPSTVAQNIYLILSPSLFIAGMSFIMSLIKKSRRGFWILILIPIVLFSLYSILIAALVFIGAAYLIIDYAGKWASANERK